MPRSWKTSTATRSHCGKTPRRSPQLRAAETELVQLRNRLKNAVTKEDYEEAARIRDRIKQLEEI